MPGAILPIKVCVLISQKSTYTMVNSFVGMSGSLLACANALTNADGTSGDSGLH
jgi:hypothetical protein